MTSGPPPRPPAPVTLDDAFPLLGAEIRLRVTAATEAQADAAQDAAFREIMRLQEIVTVFDEGSELVRWRSGRLERPGPELTEVLRQAHHWWGVSGGAFHPASGVLRAAWLRAEAHGVPPSQAELDTLVAALAQLPFEVDAAGVRRVGDCHSVDLNAIAKGWIVDRAAERAASEPGVTGVLVDAGGDRRALGTESLGDGPAGASALASLRPDGRGFGVRGRWYSPVLDPRVGRPVEPRGSTEVAAPDAATADALATICAVLAWDEARALVATLPGVGVRVVSADGRAETAGDW